MNRRVKVIIRNLIIGLIITAVMAVAFQIYYGSTYTLGVILIGVIATVLISKAFLLPFAKKTIEGTVIKSTVKNYIVRKGPYGKGAGSVSGSTRTVSGYKYSGVLRVAVTVKTIQGHKFWKTFNFNGEADEIPIGTKIRFTIFDDEPEFLKKPQK